MTRKTMLKITVVETPETPCVEFNLIYNLMYINTLHRSYKGDMCTQV